MSVMRIKDANGNWHEVAALTGIQGPEGPVGPAGDTKVFVVNMYDLKTADATAQEILDAVASGRVCILRDVVFGTTYLYAGEEQNPSTNVLEPMFVAPIKSLGIDYFHPYVFVSADGNVTPKRNNIKTPTPLSLKLTGAVEAEFDGSKSVTVEIPEGGSTSKYAQPDWGDDANGVILPETTLEVSAEEGVAVLMSPLNAPIVEGEVYTIGFNGAEYQCTAVYQSDFGHALGNGAPMGIETPDTDAPFLLGVMPAESSAQTGIYAVCVPFDGSASCTVSINGNVTHKIPEDYVEGGGVFYVYVDVLKENDEWVITPNKTFDEVFAAIKNGEQVYADIMGMKVPLNWYNDANIAFMHCYFPHTNSSGTTSVSTVYLGLDINGNHVYADGRIMFN